MTSKPLWRQNRKCFGSLPVGHSQANFFWQNLSPLLDLISVKKPIIGLFPENHDFAEINSKTLPAKNCTCPSNFSCFSRTSMKWLPKQLCIMTQSTAPGRLTSVARNTMSSPCSVVIDYNYNVTAKLRQNHSHLQRKVVITPCHFWGLRCYNNFFRV